MAEIDVDISNSIATITLNRPPVNALSVNMIDAFVDLLRTIDESADVRVVIVTGAGRCFSAGLDLKEQLTAIEAGEPGPAGRGLDLYRALIEGAKPIVAAINGPALGAGLGIAASCSILVASDRARVGIPEVGVGMLGGARHAMRILGHSTVNRMLLTGHQLSGQELYERNVVEACLSPSELLPFATSLAEEIVAKNPVTIQLAKRCLVDVEMMNLLDGYQYEMRRSQELVKNQEARDAMRSFLHRRHK